MDDICFDLLAWETPTEEILEIAGRLGLNAPDKYGDYLLTSACQRLRVDLVQSLLGLNANVNCQNLDGDTPLLCTIDYTHHNPPAALEISKLLIASRAEIELRGYMDKTPFLKACSRGCLDILQLLVENGCDTHAACEDEGGCLDGKDYAQLFETSIEFRLYLNGLYAAA
jgi:ankyrin repeat protein